MTYSERVIEAIQSGQLDIVDENIQQALSADGQDTLYLLANTLLQLGFLEEAKKVYNNLLLKNPDDNELKIYLAEIELEDGNEIEALDLLHSIDKQSEEYPQSLLAQADYYYLQNLPEVSIQKLKEALEIIPNEPVIEFALAEVYSTMADHENAIIYYNNILKEDIQEIAGTQINARLGDNYLMIGEYQLAEKHLKISLDVQENPVVQYQLGFVYIKQEKYDLAINMLTNAKDNDPTLEATYLLLADSYEKTNRLEDALAVIQEGISINEINTELYLIAADLSIKLNKYSLTNDFYKKASELDPDNEQIILKYAQYLSYMEEYEEAINLYKETSITKYSPDSAWLLAVANNEIEEFEKARELFDEAHKYLSDQVLFLKDYILFLREDGQREKMKDLILKYQELNPDLDEEILSLLDDEPYF